MYLVEFMHSFIEYKITVCLSIIFLKYKLCTADSGLNNFHVSECV